MGPINCLKGTGTDEEEVQAKDKQKAGNLKLRLKNVERSWSGNLGRNPPKAKPDLNKSRSGWLGNPKGGPMVDPGPDPDTPRLMRSSGMRRDWSFEDPREIMRGWNWGGDWSFFWILFNLEIKCWFYYFFKMFIILFLRFQKNNPFFFFLLQNNTKDDGSHLREYKYSHATE